LPAVTGAAIGSGVDCAVLDDLALSLAAAGPRLRDVVLLDVGAAAGVVGAADCGAGVAFRVTMLVPAVAGAGAARVETVALAVPAA
jgi:hypothetical protein